MQAVKPVKLENPMPVYRDPEPVDLDALARLRQLDAAALEPFIKAQQDARMEVQRIDALIEEQEAKRDQLNEQAEQIEMEAGDAVLRGGDLNTAGGKIAAARAAVHAMERAIAAAGLEKEHAIIEIRRADLALLRERERLIARRVAAQLKAVDDFRQQVLKEHGFCYWRVVTNPTLDMVDASNYASQAISAEIELNHREQALNAKLARLKR